MTMSRAQLVAELWGRMQVQFTRAGIVNEDTSGNLKEPVDSALGAIGVSYSTRATGEASDDLADVAIAWAVFYGCQKVLDAVAHEATSTSKSVSAPGVSLSANGAEFIRAVERMRDNAKARAEALTPGGTWVFTELDNGLHVTSDGSW